MRNIKKFITELEAQSTNLKMIKYCKSLGLKVLGKGSTRIVFELSSTKVLKIALNEFGKQQNENEYQVWNYLDFERPGFKQYYAKIFMDMGSMTNTLYVIQERLQSVSTKEAKGYIYGSSSTDKRAIRFEAALKEIDEVMGHCSHQDCYKDNLGRNKAGNIKTLDYGLSRSLAKIYHNASINGKYHYMTDTKVLQNA